MSLLSAFKATDVPEGDKSTLELIFSEEPVPLRTFIADRQFLDSPPLSDIQYDAVRHIEQVFLPETYDLMVEGFGDYWKPYRFINKAVLQWGKGSGKDHICRVSSMRIAYLLQCLRSPQNYFSMPRQDTIHLLNVASTKDQARAAFFTPMTKLVQNSWFADKCNPTKDAISWAKNVEMLSGSADAESQEGLNLILGVADEIDAFKSKAELMAYRPRMAREPTKSAEAILSMIESSAMSRFDTYKNVVISYPRYLGSTIQKQTKEAVKDIAKNGAASQYYVSGPHATWEVNPRVKGKIQFAKAYDKDPIKARAQYECVPARAEEPYFRNSIAVESTMDETRGTPVEISYSTERTAQGATVWRAMYQFSPDLVPIVGAQYCVHADLAIKGDRAGVAMSHVKNWREETVVMVDDEGAEDHQVVRLPSVKVDFVTSYGADILSEPAREIQIRWVRQLVMELRQKGFNIVSVSYDQFQSADSMQILTAQGIESMRVSADVSEAVWKNLRDLMYEGRIDMPHRQTLLDELLSLEKLINGKVDHPATGSKDEADALACSVMRAVEVGGQESETGEVATLRSNRFEALPMPEEFFAATHLPFGR